MVSHRSRFCLSRKRYTTVDGRDVRGGGGDSSARYALWVSVHYDIIVIIIVIQYLLVTGAYITRRTYLYTIKVARPQYRRFPFQRFG